MDGRGGRDARVRICVCELQGPRRGDCSLGMALSAKWQHVKLAAIESSPAIRDSNLKGNQA